MRRSISFVDAFRDALQIRSTQHVNFPASLQYRLRNDSWTSDELRRLFVLSTRKVENFSMLPSVIVGGLVRD
jgi:hypothetical protein